MKINILHLHDHLTHRIDPTFWKIHFLFLVVIASTWPSPILPISSHQIFNEINSRDIQRKAWQLDIFDGYGFHHRIPSDNHRVLACTMLLSWNHSYHVAEHDRCTHHKEQSCTRVGHSGRERVNLQWPRCCEVQMPDQLLLKVVKLLFCFFSPIQVRLYSRHYAAVPILEVRRVVVYFFSSFLESFSVSIASCYRTILFYTACRIIASYMPLLSICCHI